MRIGLSKIQPKILELKNQKHSSVNVASSIRQSHTLYQLLVKRKKRIEKKFSKFIIS